MRAKRCGDPNAETKYDMNKISRDGDTVAIKIGRQEALIDAEDLSKIENIKWGITSHGYAYNAKNKTYLHHAIMGKWKGLVIDHMNMNKLDNRKINLRFVETSINLINRPQPANNTSGYKGVIKTKTGRWAVHIHIKGIHQRYYGTFENREDAARAYNHFIEKYSGMKVWLNPV
jgi:hypothetical protein